MKGWLLDTHVVAALADLNGAPSVKQWTHAQSEALFGAAGSGYLNAGHIFDFNLREPPPSRAIP